MAEGAKVSVHDPLIDSEPLEDAIKGAEILIVGINHDAFSKISLEYLGNSVSPDCLIVDIWNMFGTGKIVFYLKDVLAVKEKLKARGNGELKVLGKKSPPQRKLSFPQA